MSDKKHSNEKRMLALFKRLQKIGLNQCPIVEDVISPAQMALLERIARHPSCGVVDIAKALNLSVPTVSVGAAKLEERGLIVRKPDPNDGRSVQFFITNAGETLHKQFNQARLQKFRRLLTGLSTKEQEQLLNLLELALQSAETDETDDEPVRWSSQWS